MHNVCTWRSKTSAVPFEGCHKRKPLEKKASHWSETFRWTTRPEFHQGHLLYYKRLPLERANQPLVRRLFQIFLGNEGTTRLMWWSPTPPPDGALRLHTPKGPMTLMRVHWPRTEIQSESRNTFLGWSCDPAIRSLYALHPWRWGRCNFSTEHHFSTGCDLSTVLQFSTERHFSTGRQRTKFTLIRTMFIFV